MRCQRQRHIGHVSRQPRVLGQDELVEGTPGRENQLGGLGLMLRARRLAVLVHLLRKRDGAGAAHVCLLLIAVPLRRAYSVLTVLAGRGEARTVKNEPLSLLTHWDGQRKGYNLGF